MRWSFRDSLLVKLYRPWLSQCVATHAKCCRLAWAWEFRALKRGILYRHIMAMRLICLSSSRPSKEKQVFIISHIVCVNCILSAAAGGKALRMQKLSVIIFLELSYQESTYRTFITKTGSSRERARCEQPRPAELTLSEPLSVLLCLLHSLSHPSLPLICVCV